MLVPTIVFVLLIGVYFVCYVVITNKDTLVENKIKELNVLNLILFFVTCCYISYFFGGV